MSRPHGIVPGAAARGLRGRLLPVARGLASLGVSPNAVTVGGSVVTLAGAALLVLWGPSVAIVPLVVGALADSLDGALARATGRESVFGNFLDSTLDRVSDAALFVAAALIAAGATDLLGTAVALVALVASFLVSYTRAKAESLELDATVGLAPREARTVVLLLGLAVWALTAERSIFTFAIGITAILATVTVVQRIAHVAQHHSPRP